MSREQVLVAYRRLAQLDVVQAVAVVVGWGLEELREGRDATTPPAEPAEGVDAGN